MKIPNPSLPNSNIGFGSDPQKLFLISMVLSVGFLVFLGDRVCFNRIPEFFWETLIGYPTAWGYLIFEDRFFSNLFAGTLWSVVLGLIFYLIFTQWERHWIEPMMAKKAVAQMEREKKWMNKYGKDLF